VTGVFIDGAAGTTGLNIRERLEGRADLRLILLDDEARKNREARRQALNDADVAILCLPDEAAREAVALIANDRTRVIDASTAYRVAPDWTYGFPELEPDGGARVAAAMRVSNPGCYPTGFLALVRPLVRAGLVPADQVLAIAATSGYSGGGKAMIAEFEGGGPAPAHRAYAMGLAHKHVPEMTRHAGLTATPIFLPAVANTFRGMIVEVPLDAARLPGRPSRDAVEALLAEAYADAPLVRVATDTPATVAVEEMAGTDAMTLRVFGNDAAGQLRLVATLDNLGKGAGGAAVQNLNLMAGVDPLAGLVL
jgi:N-acetyl-gamma-glutamyl-phosphate reductase